MLNHLKSGSQLAVLPFEHSILDHLYFNQFGFPLSFVFNFLHFNLFLRLYLLLLANFSSSSLTGLKYFIIFIDLDYSLTLKYFLHYKYLFDFLNLIP